MVKIKRFLSLLIIFVVMFAVGINFERIEYEIRAYFANSREIVPKSDNGFKKNYSYNFVHEADDFVPYSKDDLFEIFYTILNNGWEDFTFYCPYEYTSCINDINELSSNTSLLSDLNNYVSSFNSYDTLRTVYDTSGEINVSVSYKYNSEERYQISDQIDQIINNKIDVNMSDKEKIKTIHDYIVNNTKYDNALIDTDETIYDSERIYGVLRDGYAICSGYADTMEVFLTKLNIPNFKVSSENHVWNAVYIDGEWLHLDVTWDDPTTDTGEDILSYNYFLINTDDLDNDDDVNKHEHEFDIETFSEFKCVENIE